jgi:hypothetical protein
MSGVLFTKSSAISVAKNVRVTVTGVAFFDILHGQEGVASNGVELHPILAIEFRRC